MPKKKCAFGFNCGSMMMQPGLLAEMCPNNLVCGTITELSPEEEIELYRIRETELQENQLEREQIRERIWVNQREAASLMLMSRGCPQNLSSMGILESLSLIEVQFQNLRGQLEQYENKYIAPQGCEAHTYNVKRPWGTYPYNKLSAEQAIFEPSERETKVKVIHLSHDDDPRNQEARAGIDRRNKLQKLANRLAEISEKLESVLAEL